MARSQVGAGPVDLGPTDWDPPASSLPPGDGTRSTVMSRLPFPRSFPAAGRGAQGQAAYVYFRLSSNALSWAYCSLAIQASASSVVVKTGCFWESKTT